MQIWPRVCQHHSAQSCKLQLPLLAFLSGMLVKPFADIPSALGGVAAGGAVRGLCAPRALQLCAQRVARAHGARRLRRPRVGRGDGAARPAVDVDDLEVSGVPKSGKKP